MSRDKIEFSVVSTILSVHPLKVIPDDRPLLEDELSHTASGKAIPADMTDSDFKIYCHTMPMKACKPDTIMDLNGLKNRFCSSDKEALLIIIRKIKQA